MTKGWRDEERKKLQDIQEYKEKSDKWRQANPGLSDEEIYMRTAMTPEDFETLADWPEPEGCNLNSYLERFFDWGEYTIVHGDKAPGGILAFVPNIFDPTKDNGLLGQFEGLNEEAYKVYKAISKDPLAWARFQDVFNNYIIGCRKYKDGNARPVNKASDIRKMIDKARGALEALRPLTWLYGVDEWDYCEPLDFLDRLRKNVESNISAQHGHRKRHFQAADVFLITELFDIASEMGLDTELVIDIAAVGHTYVYGTKPRDGWMESKLALLKKGINTK